MGRFFEWSEWALNKIPKVFRQGKQGEILRQKKKEAMWWWKQGDRMQYNMEGWAQEAGQLLATIKDKEQILH